jgi:hypothetical protein
MSERNVFAYHDGAGTAYADPVAVYRRFMEAVGGDPDPLLKAAQRPAPGAAEDPGGLLRRLDAERLLALAARAALPMRPFDPATGEGATDEDCLAALYAWMEWLEGNAARAAS